MATLKYSGNLELMTVALASDYTAASGSMALTAGHGARLPSAGDFWIRTKTGTYRAFKVTARSTDTLTVVAAQDGTSDGNLSAGAELFWALTLSALDQLRADLNQTGTTANLPSTAIAKAGDEYCPSDSVYKYRFNGSIWEPWGPCFKLTPPVLADWTKDSGAGAFVETYGGWLASGANNEASIYSKSQSFTVPFRVESAWLGLPGNENYTAFFVAIKETSSGKEVRFNHNWNGFYKLAGQRITAEVHVSWVSEPAFGSAIGYLGPFLALAIHQTTTARNYQIGVGLNQWVTLFSTANTDHFTTPNTVRIGVNGSTNRPPSGWLIHWRYVQL